MSLVITPKIAKKIKKYLCCHKSEAWLAKKIHKLAAKEEKRHAKSQV
jgi:hypothetical protein